MADCALVVGIELYATPAAKTLVGPALDALRFALWLRVSLKLPSANIMLFANPCEWTGVAAEIYKETATRVAAAGIRVRDELSRSAIMKAWREELLSGPEELGTVWLYWSGHGLTFPKFGQAVLCADIEFGEPSFIFLSELRDCLRSEIYRRFNRQRLFIDACAEYLTPEELNITGFRNPVSWTIKEAPDQVELDAVALGSVAVAEQGGSLFSRILFKELEDHGWPDDPRDLYTALDSAIRAEKTDESRLPRLRILSPRFEAGIDTGSHADECKRLLEMLWNCNIPFESYRPAYSRTMGDLTADPRVLAASTLTEMIRELLDLKREADFGNRSLGIVEFFERVRREFMGEAAPISAWLDGVPPGALLSVREKLDKESSALVLTITLFESWNNRNGFPASIHAVLSDANFTGSVRSWDCQDLQDQKNAETQARIILNEADAYVRRQKNARLTIQVFANPPLLGMPWHAIQVDPEDDVDCAVFGQMHSFVLRSRDRLNNKQKYDMDSWRQKASALRNRPCNLIAIARAPVWSDATREDVNDMLAKVDGLLLIGDLLDAPSQTTEGLYKLLKAALRRGVPLASWRVPVAGTTRPAATDIESDLKTLFGACSSLAQTPERFMNARKSEPWARQTALFWDDDDSESKRERLLLLMGEEPIQL